MPAFRIPSIEETLSYVVMSSSRTLMRYPELLQLHVVVPSQMHNLVFIFAEFHEVYDDPFLHLSKSFGIVALTSSISNILSRVTC